MFLRPAGHHVAAWRHPDAQVDAGWNFSRFAQLAQTAERGFFDMLFLADTSGVPSDDMENARHTAGGLPTFYGHSMTHRDLRT
jgi:N-acetyl-S-(2-succino)cysteine monooxygenase